jgi:hypothetical protein
VHSWKGHPSGSIVTQRRFIVGFDILTAVVATSCLFYDIKPCSPLKVKRRFGGTCRLILRAETRPKELKPRAGEVRHYQRSYERLGRPALEECKGVCCNSEGCFDQELFLMPLTLVSCLTYFSILKKEATCFTETSVGFQRSLWRYIQEVRTLCTLLQKS